MTTDADTPVQTRKWLLVQRLAMDPRLNQSAVVVMIRLLDYMNLETLVAFPANATLAADVRISERAVQDALALLRSCGYIETRPRGKGWQHLIIFDHWPLPEGRRAGARTSKTARPRKAASGQKGISEAGFRNGKHSAPDLGHVRAMPATSEADPRRFNVANLQRGTRSRKPDAAFSEASRSDLGSALPTNLFRTFSEPTHARDPPRAATRAARPQGALEGTDTED